MSNPDPHFDRSADENLNPFRPLLEPLPPSLAEELKKQGSGPDRLQLCTHSDIDLQGNYSAEWIAVDDRATFILGDGHQPI